jgi:ribosomal protein S27AE
MFKCGSCKKQTDPRVKGVVRTIETRMKTYYNKQGQYQGEGEEIVSESRICPKCAEDVSKYPYEVERMEKVLKNS